MRASEKMNVSYFNVIDNILYTRMALFSWDCKEAPSRVNHDNIKFFISNLQNVPNLDAFEYILINFNQIEDTDDHIYRDLIQCALEQGIKLFCFVTTSHIKPAKPFEQINNSSKEFKKGGTPICINSMVNDEISYISINMTMEDIVAITQSKRFENIKYFEEKLVKDLVSSSYIEFENKRQLSSTPLLAPGEFNASEIISEPLSFKWMILLMVDLIVINIDKEINKIITIVASSLRGSAIALSVWEVLQDYFGVDLYIIDHLGPNYDLSEPTPLHINSEHSLIYIGDFLIAGSELKTTDMYCHSYGGKIDSAFVIGKYTKQENISSGIKLYSLTNLKDCVNDLRYELA
ncbi:hypothetical protein INR79_23420 [Vibrio sp. SCSIO 43132]|uniref:hypothetical protein n=1 Tax=Vibrio sp. SCSIO 43132 TaxID=2779363 RepID=UPI001CA80788|nr:hypothetical protein [Vibrio sp. SCSIO 43132]UAB72217.1 hypothetical protein INR79_23420 [Vibrio sp. SCSIO 43132]